MKESAQAMIRLGDLRKTLAQNPNAPDATLILVRVDETPPAVRFVVLSPQTQSKLVVSGGPLRVGEEEESELAGAPGIDLLAMLMREVSVRTPNVAPRVVALELELRRRMAQHDRFRETKS